MMFKMSALRPKHDLIAKQRNLHSVTLMKHISTPSEQAAGPSAVNRRLSMVRKSLLVDEFVT
jgi:hypothetical protein